MSNKNNKNESKIKNMNIKNISIQGNNNKNKDLFEDDYLIQLRKENDTLKKLIISYRTINFNNYKKAKKISKQKSYFINSRKERFEKGKILIIKMLKKIIIKL